MTGPPPDKWARPPVREWAGPAPAPVAVPKRRPPRTPKELARIWVHARRVYRLCAAIDPEDSTGLVARIHVLYLRIFWKAAVGVSRVGTRPQQEPGRVKRDAAGYRLNPGAFPEVTLNSVEIASRQLSHYEYVDFHLIGEMKSLIDFYATIIPRLTDTNGRPIETIAQHRARIARRTRLWKSNVSEAVAMGRSPVPQAVDAGPPQRGLPGPPATTGTHTESRKRKVDGLPTPRPGTSRRGR